jgi:transcription elongation factor GreA
MSDVVYLTKEGYDRLTSELEELKSTERPKIAEAIAEAREKGDLSENAEYKAAKDEQGMLELKINQLESKLAVAKILDTENIDTSRVSLLTTVTMRNTTTKKDLTYTLVPEAESDLKEKKIASNSPVGKGIMGKKVGEIAEVETPRGVLKFEIINITA